MTAHENDAKEFEFEIDLSDECKTETTVLNFLTLLGFNLLMSGTRYLIYIIATCVNMLTIPFKMKDFYALAAKRFDQDHKAVEVAVWRAFSFVKRTKLQLLNTVFNCEILDNDIMNAGLFITTVCARFAMLKAHKKGISIFG